MNARPLGHGQARAVPPRAVSASCFLSPQTDRPGIDLAISPGTVIGRFTVIARLGAGATGTVYRAHDALRGGEVAIKVAAADVANGHEIAPRLLREVTVNAKLVDHRHVIRIYDLHSATVNGHAVTIMSMEVADGGTLDKWIQNHVTAADRLPSAVERFREVAKGLKALHDSGHQHGDVLGRNVLIVGGRAKLADLGEATPITPPARLGPSNAGHASHNDEVRSDIGMLGTILAHAAVCSLGETALGTPSSLHDRSPDEYVDSRAWEKTPVAHIVSRCVYEDDERRYRRIDELIEDVEAYLLAVGMMDLTDHHTRPRQSDLRQAAEWQVVHGLMLRGEYSTALIVCRRLVEAASHPAAADVVMLTNLQDRSRQAEALHQAAACALERSDLAEASRLVETAAALFPGHPATAAIQTCLGARMASFHEFVQCGRGQTDRGNCREAIAYYSRALEVNRNACWLVGTIEKLKAELEKRGTCEP